jgi:hypothetical protein
VLVFGCAYWRIADGSCSDTTCLEERGLLAEIAQKGKPTPLTVTKAGWWRGRATGTTPTRSSPSVPKGGSRD